MSDGQLGFLGIAGGYGVRRTRTQEFNTVRFFDWLTGGDRGRPSARRVTARAMVLSTVICRGYLEQEHRAGVHKNAEGRLGLLDWLEEWELLPEAEPWELRFLQTPVGEAEDQVFQDAVWRTEGLGVLAWTLGRFELAPYDGLVDPDAAQQAVGFLEPDPERDPRRVAALRPASEVERLAGHLTVVGWRIRQFRLDPTRAVPSSDFRVEGGRPETVAGSLAERRHTGPGIGTRMDFAEYLRAHPRFQDSWLVGLQLVDGDLAIRGKAIAEADSADVKTCASIARERQIAAYWLRGHEPTYSKVQANTLLSGF